jgi:hypothetical protein
MQGRLDAGNAIMQRSQGRAGERRKERACDLLSASQKEPNILVPGGEKSGPNAPVFVSLGPHFCATRAL